MTTFSELPLSASLQQKLAANQFITLTPIQEQAIPPALEGKDVIGTAQTGTGKTLAFLLPMIELLRREPSKQAKALVLLPTRELAQQVHAQFEMLCGKNICKAALVIGGRFGEDPDSTSARGRWTDHRHPRTLAGFHRSPPGRLAQVKMLVLDEADRMLDMGFLPAIRRVLEVAARRSPDAVLLCHHGTVRRQPGSRLHAQSRAGRARVGAQTCGER